MCLQKGILKVICGPMFSGKTSALIGEIATARADGLNVVVFNHASDKRYAESGVVSHDGAKELAFSATSAEDILRAVVEKEGSSQLNVDAVYVDEVQFYDGEISSLLEEFAAYGKRVVVAGLDLDFRGKPFPVVADLCAKADYVEKKKGVCAVCGKDSTHSYLKNENKANGNIVVGGADLYDALCRKCFMEKKRLGDSNDENFLV